MSGVCLESLWESKMRRWLTVIIGLNPGEIRHALQLPLRWPSGAKVTVKDLIRAGRVMGEGRRQIQARTLVENDLH